MNKFGITLDDAIAIWNKLEQKCWLCKRSLPFNKSIVDHDHKTGRIRGLAHSSCNAIVGMAREDTELMLSIAEAISADRIHSLVPIGGFCE